MQSKWLMGRPQTQRKATTRSRAGKYGGQKLLPIVGESLTVQVGSRWHDLAQKLLLPSLLRLQIPHQALERLLISIVVLPAAEITHVAHSPNVGCPGLPRPLE